MLEPFKSRLIADVGIAFGDEGKGRLVYEVIEELRQSTGLPEPVAMVLKVNGGANSGHTAGGLKLNLLPGGVIDPTVGYLALGSGVVADPRKLLWEITATEAKGFDVMRRMAIDERTMISDLSHRLLDLASEHYREKVLGQLKRGSTGRGITPAYGDETGQQQIFFSDLLGPKDRFAEKMRHRIDRCLRMVQHVYRVDAVAWKRFFHTLTDAETRANREAIDSGALLISEFDFHRFAGSEPFSLNEDALIDAYWEKGKALADRIVDVRNLILKSISRKQTVIGEFGQSYWLDKRHGFSPNVTASHTFTAEFFESGGIPVQPIHTIGVAKAYDTKVGTHHFISQIEEEHPLRQVLEKLEFGTSTGRQRMVGWFDAVEKGTTLRYGGFDDLVINKLDALGHTGIDHPLKICVAYEGPEGQRYLQTPRNDGLRTTLRPVYTETESWNEDISKIQYFEDLPMAAKRYVALMLKSIIDCAADGESPPPFLPNLRYIGVGPDPRQILKDVPPTPLLLKLLD